MAPSLRSAAPFLLCLAVACGSSSDDAAPTDPGTPPGGSTPVVAAIEGTSAAFDLEADTAKQENFFASPYPSDLRLTPEGAPEVQGWPGNIPIVEGLRKSASERRRFPVVPVGYFAFSAPMPSLDVAQVITPSPTSPVLLVDIDPASPDLGKLYPTVATVPAPDGYVPDNLLAVAARPGIVLHPLRTYAFVVLRSLADAAGKPLGVPLALARLKAGLAPEGAKGEAAKALYAPLWPALAKAGVDASAVAAATVFTTADVVTELADLSSKLRAQHQVDIVDVAVDPDDGAAHPGYCELHARITYPQFQRGKPPFNTEGTFDLSSGDVPPVQRQEQANVVLSMPKAPMPAGGYPLVVYFHGSGGRPGAIADRGTWRPESDVSKCPDGTLDDWQGTKGCNDKGAGPASINGPLGLGMAATALPVNPERLPGAEATAYLNFANLPAFRDTFRQGVIEQRMFIDALERLTVAPDVVAACQGMSLPPGETSYRYSTKPLMAMGQSMGGMYTNLIGAVDPRIEAVVPTGAGGFWSYFILETSLVPNAGGKVALLLGTKPPLSFVHPALHLLQTAWEVADPIVYMPRLARRPLPGHPVRPIYEPVGKDDSYFPISVFDAVALSYGHQQAGDEVWPGTQQALSLVGLSGLLPYPVHQNMTSDGGTPYTGAVVQFAGDGVYDPHAIYTQLEGVKYQYSCFFSSFRATGKATIFAPKTPGMPCE